MRRITTPVRLFPLLTVSLVGLIIRAGSHHESGPWTCEPSSQVRVDAQFRPGIVTLDGRADDWKDVDGSEFSLLPALDPDEDKEYKGGKMIVKALHDGRSVYFLLQVDGNYAYTKGDSKKCPSVALMFQIGQSATYHNMGGCSEGTDTCTSTTCKGREVDIMHFSIGNAIPGRIYGGNPVDNGKGNGGDRFGQLIDLFSWTPHCMFLDGTGPSGNDSSAQNDWSGAWWHSSLTNHLGFVEEDSPYASSSQKGTYFFEISRPLRTTDRIQQDVQFTIGNTTKMAVAFWYPVDGTPWHGSGHYSINCDWVPLDTSFGGASLTKAGSTTHSWDVASAFSLVLAVISLCLSIFIVYRVMGPRNIAYKPMETAPG